jgi:hypothetical protein
MQDNATAQTANNSMVALDEVFGEWVISWRLWPRRSPDLNTCDFYLWGTERKSVYEQSTLFGRTSNIKREISAIPVQELRHVPKNTFSLCEACLEAEIHHFETLP